MAEPIVKPREARESVFLSAVVTHFGDDQPTQHRVRNISTHGVCLDQVAKLRKGQTVLIDMGLLEEVGATVVWIANNLAGLRFAHPIPIDAAKTRPKPAHVAQGWQPGWSGFTVTLTPDRTGAGTRGRT
jgi:hypothetical protein